MRELLHPAVDQLSLSTVLNALGDPVRLQILAAIAKQDEVTCSCCNVGLPKSALSHHFKVLRESGIIRVRIEGTQRFLSLRAKELESRFPGLLDSILKSL